MATGWKTALGRSLEDDCSWRTTAGRGTPDMKTTGWIAAQGRPREDKWGKLGTKRHTPPYKPRTGVLSPRMASNGAVTGGRRAQPAEKWKPRTMSTVSALNIPETHEHTGSGVYRLSGRLAMHVRMFACSIKILLVLNKEIRAETASQSTYLNLPRPEQTCFRCGLNSDQFLERLACTLNRVQDF